LFGELPILAIPADIGFIWGLIGCFAFIYTVVFELTAYL
jgi:hypothetical protein